MTKDVRDQRSLPIPLSFCSFAILSYYNNVKYHVIQLRVANWFEEIEILFFPDNDTIVCETVLPDNCTVKYIYETLSNDTVRVHVQRKTGK